MTGPLDDHAARAELVDLAAKLRTQANYHFGHGDLDCTVAFDSSASQLEAVLRRWDILPRQAA